MHSTACRTPSGPCSLTTRGQVLALDVLHHQVVHALVLAGVVGGDDVGMRELGGRLHLAVEPLDGPGLLHGREEITLIATRRSIRRCWAFKTTPMPPSPSLSSTTYSPKTSPLVLPS